eukprot:gene1093-1384_t
MSSVPISTITERTNELTQDLDRVSSLGILKLLRQCDAQIFSGYLDFEGFSDTLVQDEILSMIDTIQRQLSSNTSKIVNFVMAGAGTSGRLAFFISRSFNIVMKQLGLEGRVKFNYLIAGGDRSLTVGIEGAEDDIHQAVTDIKGQISNDSNDTLVYFGITCGLSAPYIAAQLDHLLQINNSNHIISIMGFSPLAMARKIVIEKWDKSFDDIVKAFQKQSKESPVKRHFALVPVVGPEPLTGSTRMKSGTSTKILLEIIFSMSLNQWLGDSKLPLLPNHPTFKSSTTPRERLQMILSCYEDVCRDTYLNDTTFLGDLVAAVGESLKTPDHKGHLYYLAQDSLGIVGFIDASETVPTFGAWALDVCGFLLNGDWNTMMNRDGDLSHLSPQYQISHNHFKENQIKNLNSSDTLVISLSSTLENNNNLFEILELISKLDSNSQPNIYILHFTTISNSTTTTRDKIKSISSIFKQFEIKLRHSEIIPNLPNFIEISLKWIFNALTTGGFVLAGKVYGNRMIDLGLTNNKLFYRSCGIIQSIAKVSAEIARIQLLRSIYSFQDTTIPSDIDGKQVFQHIDYAKENNVENIVPVALLLASGKYQTPQLAREAIEKQPIIRLHLL